MKILHLEDNPADAELTRTLLAQESRDCEVLTVANRADYEQALRRQAFHVILSDYSLPDFDGMAALTLARELAPDTPFIFCSGSIGEDRAIAALQAGAADYVLKDRLQRLAPVLRRAVDEAAERRARRQAEELAREQAEVIEQSPAAIVITDLQHRVTYCNAGARQLYGLAADEMLGRTADQLFPPETMACLGPGRAACFATGRWHGEVPFVTRDGRHLVTDFFMNLIHDEAGRPRARLSIAVDITEKKRLEEQFLRAQRMENLGLLAAGIAHDFNNVLAPVLMISHLLRTRLTAPADQRLLATLGQSAERGAALVRQILGFAQGSGDERVPLQPRHLARDIVAFLESSFPRTITIEHAIPGDLWTIRANPTQIHQVLLNLCVNARDAMPHGGTLHLRLDNVELDDAGAATLPDARPGAFVRLRVTDTGTGIPDHILPRIWEPFFTTKGKSKGTGLGLSTVRGIVSNHGGFCHAANRPRGGAEFLVFLPAADAAAANPDTDPDTDDAPRGNGETVLVIDDEPAVREVAQTTLVEYGYRVHAAADGIEAVALLDDLAAPVHVILTDVSMPRFSGAPLLALLRRLRPGARILVMSGHSADDAGTVQLGDARLDKPFTPDALLRSLRQLLRPARRA